MDYLRLGQLAGVVIAGLGVGVLFAAPEYRGGAWVVLGIGLYAACRLIPWLRRRD
jgi:hypothetical protein